MVVHTMVPVTAPGGTQYYIYVVVVVLVGAVVVVEAALDDEVEAADVDEKTVFVYDALVLVDLADNKPLERSSVQADG